MKKAGIIVIIFFIFLHGAENKVMACSVDASSGENISVFTKVKNSSYHQKISSVGSKKKYRLRGLLPKMGILESGPCAYDLEVPCQYHVIHYSSKIISLFTEPEKRGPPAF